VIENVHCIGFAFYDLGLTPKERYEGLPTFYELLNLFDQVNSFNSADAIAVVAPIKSELVVVHMEVINHKKGTVRYREKAGGEVKESWPIFSAAGKYLREYRGSEKVYLAVKH